MKYFKLLGDKIEGPVKVIQYPDGQRSVCLELDNMNKKYPITIVARVKYFSDLELLSCLINALKKNDFYIQNLNFIYLFGIRSDRAFNNGEPNYFRDVVAPIINSWGIDSISLNWPFRPLAEQFKYVKNMVWNYYFPCESYEMLVGKIIIGGDESVHNFGSYYMDKRDTFKKIRENDGSLSASLKRTPQLGNIIIVDDLCDGGATFIQEAKYLVENNIRPPVLELFVYHGLFTKGIEVLAEHFDHIYCTNSYQDLKHPKLTQFEVI